MCITYPWCKFASADQRTDRNRNGDNTGTTTIKIKIVIIINPKGVLHCINCTLRLLGNKTCCLASEPVHHRLITVALTHSSVVRGAFVIVKAIATNKNKNNYFACTYAHCKAAKQF